MQHGSGTEPSLDHWVGCVAQQSGPDHLKTTDADPDR